MQFEVKALKPADGVTLLALEAGSEAEARRQAQGRGYSVLRVRVRRRAAFFGRRAFPLVLFSQELVALTDAGLPLVEALQTLAEKHKEPHVQPVFARLLAELFQGRPLSRALQACPEAFPPLYVETVRASERTGDLAGAIGRFVSYETQMQSVRATLVTASIYPALLIAVGGLVTFFLVGYIVPKFSAIYGDLGREQPLPSQILMHVGRFVGDNGILLAILMAAAAGGLVAMFSRPQLRGWLFAQCERLPGLGERIRVFQLARFYRTAGMLLQGGVPLVTALNMVGGLLDARMRLRLDQAVREVREGKALSDVMESHGLTTAIASRLLRVGERTGDMGGMMDRIATFHDAEIAQSVTHFTRLFEPILMVVIGLVIGVIVLALYMPIFDLAGSLQ
ncbi:MAG: type II secretion system F family protein [Betaproteobacteria bacterium]